MPIDLRTRLDRTALAPIECVDNFFETFGRQVLVRVLADHHHRRVHTGALAFDLLPRERSSLVRSEGARADPRLANGEQIFRAAQHAGRRAAHLHVRTRADG